MQEVKEEVVSACEAEFAIVLNEDLAGYELGQWYVSAIHGDKALIRHHSIQSEPIRDGWWL